MPPPPEERLYRLLVDEDEQLEEELPPPVAEAVPGNALRQVGALALQKVGDLAVDPKTVLVWVLAGAGAPGWMSGLLVPIRESGSLLPQVFLAPRVRRRALRHPMWVAGAVGQGAAAGMMAGVALLAEGALAGAGILLALALFATARALSSLSFKDVLGRTIPKGARGRITGAASFASGGVAITAGLALRLLGGEEESRRTLGLLLAAGGLAWVAAALLFARVVEEPGPPGGEEDAPDPLVGAWALLRDDAGFRRFVLARTLLLVSALSPPFLVTLALDQGGAALAGLGPFVLSGGVASLVGGALWGPLADRSSRLTMMAAAAAASGVILLFLGAIRVEALRETVLLYPAAYLLLALAHTGVRVGRKTYLVDMATGNERTRRVAVANTAMGILLLVTGGVGAAIAIVGAEAALLFLALLGLAGVAVSRSLPEV